MPSKELVKIETAEDAIEAIRGNLVVPVQDPEEVSRRIAEEILESDNVDDILGSRILVHAETIVNRPFTLKGVTYNRSKFDKGLTVYAVMEVTFLDNGKDASVSTSARNVCVQAAMLWKIDALPVDVKVVRPDEPTANGYYPMSLERA